MAKRPTPKKRMSRSATFRRYKAFAGNVRKQLRGQGHLTVCPKCKEKKLQHVACPTCGIYRDKQIINMNKPIDKITKVKA